MNQTKSYEVAEGIVRDLFDLGCEPDDKVQRIQFKGGEWPEKESDLGGMCESALIKFIEERITALNHHDKLVGLLEHHKLMADRLVRGIPVRDMDEVMAATESLLTTIMGAKK